jgi:salicylate hydroxylase
VGRVTLLGEAAHAMLPYTAQGAVQSIEDAAVLAKCLAQVDRNDIGAALQRYKQIRTPRVTQCQDGSLRNGVMFHLDNGEEQRKRDASFASSMIASTASVAWPYGHDVEAEFD